MSTAIEFAHTTLGNFYKASAQQIKHFNRRAVSLKYNRSISDEGIKELDPKGWGLIQMVMPFHTNYAGKTSIRVICYMKIKGSDQPERVFIDISHEDWKDFCDKSKPINGA